MYIAYDMLLHTFTYGTEIYYRVRTFLQASCWATLAHFSASATTCISACSNSDSGNFFCSASCSKDITSVRSGGEKKRQHCQTYFFTFVPCILMSTKLFIHQTNAQMKCLKNNIKIYIKTALTLLPNSATHTHQQGPTSIRSHITTELMTHR